LDSAHFGSHVLQVIAQALPGFKSFETPGIDIGDALSGNFSQNRKPVNVSGFALLHQRSRMICPHKISGGHAGLLFETGRAYCADEGEWAAL
jgi:hypothetical protein